MKDKISDTASISNSRVKDASQVFEDFPMRDDSNLKEDNKPFDDLYG